MKYIAMDFETGNRLCISACSIGLAYYEDDRLLGRDSFYIRPPESAGKFDWCAVKIHGIRRAQLANEPDFAQVWAQIAHHFENSVIICHNASFDTRVLRELLQFYNLPVPDCTYLCTVVLSRRTWPDIQRYRLNLMAEMLEIPLNHHEASSDAFACGEIFQHILRLTNQPNAAALMAQYQLPLQRLQDISLVPKNKPKRRRRVPVSKSQACTVVPTKVNKTAKTAKVSRATPTAQPQKSARVKPVKQDKKASSSEAI